MGTDDLLKQTYRVLASQLMDTMAANFTIVAVCCLGRKDSKPTNFMMNVCFLFMKYRSFSTLKSCEWNPLFAWMFGEHHLCLWHTLLVCAYWPGALLIHNLILMPRGPAKILAPAKLLYISSWAKGVPLMLPVTTIRGPFWKSHRREPILDCKFAYRHMM